MRKAMHAEAALAGFLQVRPNLFRIDVRVVLELHVRAQEFCIDLVGGLMRPEDFASGRRMNRKGVSRVKSLRFQGLCVARETDDASAHSDEIDRLAELVGQGRKRPFNLPEERAVAIGRRPDFREALREAMPTAAPNKRSNISRRCRSFFGRGGFPCKKRSSREPKL